MMNIFEPSPIHHHPMTFNHHHHHHHLHNNNNHGEDLIVGIPPTPDALIQDLIKPIKHENNNSDDCDDERGDII